MRNLQNIQSAWEDGKQELTDVAVRLAKEIVCLIYTTRHTSTLRVILVHILNMCQCTNPIETNARNEQQLLGEGVAKCLG